MTDVVAQKVTSLQRCVSRAREAHAAAGAAFREDFNLQDAAILNVIRACETAIDLANMLIRMRRLGIPTESRESFTILGQEGLVDPALASRLARMVGFRNLAVHQYRTLDPDIVESVILERLDDLLEFARVIRTRLDDSAR